MGYIINSFKQTSFLIVLNAFFSVDSFFVLSGFLMCYLTLQELNNGKKMSISKIGMMYLHRYIRITPSYAFVIFVYAFIAPYLGSGPIWNMVTDIRHNSCVSNWWRNLLYVEEFWRESCVGWGWYLSNDMLFFVISPWIIWLTHHSRKLGHFTWFLVFTASIISCVILVNKHDIKAFWVEAYLRLEEGDKTVDLSKVQDISRFIYFKPWARIQPYIVGVYAAYLQVWYGKRLFKYWKVNVLLWILSLFTLGFVLFSLHPNQVGNPFTKLENILYLSFSRFFWGIALSYIILTCINGYGGMINKLMSLSLFVPLARVGLFAYLLHPLLLDTYYFASQTPMHYTVINISYIYVGHVVFTYILAFICTAFIESPLRRLEKYLL